MSEHFTPQGPYTLGGNFEHTNANNIENGIEAVDNAKANLTGATFTGGVTAPTLVSTSGLTASGSSAGLELGAKASANTPYVDFNSSGNSNDFDARILASGGGASGTSGAGGLSIQASGGVSATGALTAPAFHGPADSANNINIDLGGSVLIHRTGASPNFFALVQLPQTSGQAYAFGARTWDGVASHDTVIVNSDGTMNGAVKVSYFSGTGSGTFNHGLGQTPSWVGITDSQGGSTMTVGATSYGSSTVVVNTGASHTWKGIAIA